MFIKVVDTIVTQEIDPEEVKTPLKEYNDKATDRVVLSKVDQPKHNVLYGDSLQRPTGERK